MKLSTGVRSTFSTLIFIGLVLGMQACGGSKAPPAPLPDQDGSGIYSGTATVDVNTSITDLRGIIYNSRLMFFSATATPHVLYDGTITSISSDDYTATVDVYENGTKTQTAVAVTGKVLTANSITGTIGTAGTAGNHNGTFSLAFDSAYNRPATTARVNTSGLNRGSWTAYGTQDIALMEFEARTDFSFFVVNSGGAGCFINNVYTIPDATVNIYKVDNFDIIDTGGNVCLDSYEGTGYSGLFSLFDDAIDGDDSRFLVAYSNGTNSVFGLVTRP